MLLKIQGFLLDGAVDELIRRTTRLTEVHILPTIERMPIGERLPIERMSGHAAV
jgi:hypothetical protein